ncbi:MAG: DJ-1/PfpI family protein [Bifidobacteriaceae bacterium]|jgi:putative intracellular protease/amidase|nr:DJ-1/PfpI family protein [Bifidobacteriaceae bacterium]
MAKKVAVLVMNPVNGAGLFQYLEAFFENKVPFKTFAVSETTSVKTNSGVEFATDDVVANLKGHEDDFDALVFACGDAVPAFGQNADKQFNQDMLAVIGAFEAKDKLLIGHCAAAMMFDNVGVGKGARVALHPFIKDAVKNVIGTDEKAVVDDNLFTAQTEDAIYTLLPQLIEALKE